MALRDYIFENFRWKLAALLLAVFAWFNVRFPLWKGFNDMHAPTLSQQPVQVLTAPGDQRVFEVKPPVVEVVLRSSSGTLRNLSPQNIQAFVNLTAIRNGPGKFHEVHVLSPAEVEVIRVKPEYVYVEEKPTASTINSVTEHEQENIRH